MQHWWQVAIRNSRARPGRTVLSTLAIALGVGAVIWVTGAYEFIRQSVSEEVWTWIGRSHLAVESKFGESGTVYQSLVEEVRAVPHVLHSTGRLKESVEAVLGRPDAESEPETALVDAVGIMPETEYQFRDHDKMLRAGHLPAPGESGVAVVEQAFANEHGLGLGDTLQLRESPFAPRFEFRIIGLVERRRVRRLQQPTVLLPLTDLQAMKPRDGVPRVTKVDIILDDTSPKTLAITAAAMRRLVDAHDQGFMLTTSEAKLQQVEIAQRQTRFILTLISSVALFTAFFIILSTMSMGMVERIGQLGLLRCVGMTRTQISLLVLGELLPIGLVGIVMGVPVGIGLIGLSVLIAPGYVGRVAVSPWGLAMALGGGAVTAIAGGLLPALQAMRISPLAATRPQSRGVRPSVDVIAAVLGAGMIVGHVLMVAKMPPIRWFDAGSALAGVMLLYCGYALLAPAVIRFGGGLFVRTASLTLGVPHRLLGDQVGRASWRSAGICSGLMVGLSLIVCLVVHTQSLTAGWDFPKRMCEAFVYTGGVTIDPARAREAVRIGGVSDAATANDFECYNRGYKGRFAVGTPEDFFRMIKLEFVGSTQEETMAKIRRGGCILASPEFADFHKLKVGDRFPIRVGQRTALFELAGLVESPALDIAAAYFNADSNLMGAQVTGVMGTFADAQRFFGIEEQVRLFLINYDLPTTEPPRLFHEPELPSLTRPAALVEWMRDWKPRMPERTVELNKIEAAWAALGERAEDTRLMGLEGDLVLLRTLRTALLEGKDGWAHRSPEERWRQFREEAVLTLITQRIDVPNAFKRSVAELKAEIDRTLNTATYLMTAVPMVALVVAALGVGNLMMANVTSRSRQLAVMRAVGATKSQVTRLVIGEALVLGTIGSALGLGLGVHAAHSVNTLTHQIWGLPMPLTLNWRFIGLAVALTVGVCLIAGVLPARRAARNNIVAAIQVG